MKTIKLFFAFCIFIGIAISTIAQNSDIKYNKYNQLYIGINGGAMVTFSNVKEKDYVPTSGELNYGGGAIIGYQISPILAFQGQFIYGDVSGKKTKWLNNAPANLKFNTNTMEFGFNATVSLSKWWAPRLKLNQKLDFYGLLGFGVVSFRSRLYTLDQGVFINASGYSKDGTTKEARTVEAVFPIGLGVKYKITEKWNIGIETNLRNINSDKFDAFERQYNPKDKYSYTFVGIQYIFGKQEQSLEWVDIIEYEKAKDETPDNSLLKKIDSLGREVAALKNKGIDSIASAIVKPVDDKVAILEGKTNNISNKVDSLMNDKQASFGAVLPSVYFETGSYSITKQNNINMAAVALYLKTNPTARLTVIAHTDKRDKSNINTKLANNRAKAVVDMLSKEYKIDKSRLDIEIKVSKDPLSTKNNAINRRADFLINK